MQPIQILNRPLSKLITVTIEISLNKIFLCVMFRCYSEDDWLAQYREHGQTFGEFMADCPWLASYQRRLHQLTFCAKGKDLPSKYPGAAIYIMPVGEFDSETTPQFEALMEFTQIFYNIPVKKLTGVVFERVGKDVFWKDTRMEKPRPQKLKSRYDEDSGHIQLQVDTSLLKLRKIMPSDAIP